MSHICYDKCFNYKGERICGFKDNFDPPPLPPKEELPVPTEVITNSCLNLMGAIQSENKSLVDHRKALQTYLDEAEESRRDMVDSEKAAEREMVFIKDKIKKLEDYKAQLLKELSPVPQEVFSIVEDIGRSA